jgi:hypothetical protein
MFVGNDVGAEIGILIDDKVGAFVRPVGAAVGLFVCDNVGSELGPFVGDKIGELVGPVGATVGINGVGEKVATPISDNVGAFEGRFEAAVGTFADEFSGPDVNGAATVGLREGKGLS